jgi:hypothetical protein
MDMKRFVTGTVVGGIVLYVDSQDGRAPWCGLGER